MKFSIYLNRRVFIMLPSQQKKENVSKIFLLEGVFTHASIQEVNISRVILSEGVFTPHSIKKVNISRVIHDEGIIAPASIKEVNIDSRRAISLQYVFTPQKYHFCSHVT